MFSEKEISTELAKIQKKHNDFTRLLHKSSKFNREAVILQDYTDRFNVHAPWFQKFKDLQVSTEFSSLTENSPIKIDHQSIPYFIEEISQHPQKRIEYLREFFTTLPDLNSADQLVLLENFQNLPLTSLRSELENLAAAFRQ